MTKKELQKVEKTLGWIVNTQNGYKIIHGPMPMENATNASTKVSGRLPVDTNWVLENFDSISNASDYFINVYDDLLEEFKSGKVVSVNDPLVKNAIKNDEEWEKFCKDHNVVHQSEGYLIKKKKEDDSLD